MRKTSYKWLILVILLTSILFALVGCKKEEKGIVARVEDEVISEEEFNTEFEVYKNIEVQQLGEETLKRVVGENGMTREEELKDEVLQMLILDKLVVIESKKNNIVVDQDEIDLIMKDYIERVGGEKEFYESLEESNMTKKFLEDSLRRSILIEKHKNDFLEKTIIEDEEAEEYFNINKEELVLVRASHILSKTEEEGKEILAKLNSGEKFEELAVEFSADKSSGAKGGDLGYFGRGSYISEFEDAVFDLEEGQVSSLVKTEVGYHIIRIDDKRDTFESLKDELVSYLKDQKYYDALQDLRENSKIKIYL